MSNMSNPVNLTIDPKVVEGIVSAQIQAAIVAQFNKTPGMMEAIVNSVIEKKVQSDGTVSDYSCRNTYSLIDVLCNKVLKEEAENALRQWVSEHRADLMTALKKGLNKQKNDLVKSFVSAADNALNSNFSVRCEMSLRELPR